MKIRLLLFVLCGSIHCIAQSADSTAKDYAHYPYWIAMMDDEHTNYLEAVKAFETYWKNRELPVETETEAHDIYADKKSENENEGLQFKHTETYSMVFAYKQFLHWKLEQAPYTDMQTGRIMTRDERLALWKKQHGYENK